MNESGSGSQHPQDPGRMWKAAQSAEDLDMSAPPWRFDQRQRHVRTAGQVAGFAEMLCQIDERMDGALPACWMRHGYLFALMDALRSEYVYAYLEAPNKSPKDPRHSYMQTRFWMDENSILQMVKDYATARALGNPDTDKHESSQYSEKTRSRRESEKSLGIDVAECFPWDENGLADLAEASWRPARPGGMGAWGQDGLGFDGRQDQDMPGESMPGFESGAGPEGGAYDSPWLDGDDFFSQDSA
ncbi:MULTISPECIES: hypothetical protein [Bifidobacterium]|uniref:hypothetical protein n=1 Tax=Bifidobacterium TaxID=1678 RepID=UPI0018DBF541|nr:MULTISPECIES: hypothetical protein [Bifidobacterium]MBH9981093.1 hypothetical protein [Bifidobacterium asteroides]MBI0100359.1 hypothetical protein [Bifidobacterium sp. W8114]